MKAAVLHEFGSVPRYEDFSEPTAEAGDVLIRVKAAVLENFDKIIIFHLTRLVHHSTMAVRYGNHEAD